MTKTGFINWLNAGIVFGIITIFLVLIGFHATIANIIGKALGEPEGFNIAGLAPAIFNWLIFLGLLGLWTGAHGSRKLTSSSFSSAGFAGLIAGASHGLLVGMLAYIVAALDAQNVKMSNYLSQLLPDNIHVFLLGKGPAQVAIFYFLFLLIAGLAGGLLAWAFQQPGWRKPITDGWNRGRASLLQSGPGQAIQRSPYSRYALYALLLLVVFLMPLRIGQYWNYTVGTVGIYVLLGLGLNIVVGLAGLLDLGYVAFFAIGAYTMALMTAPAPHHLLWSFWIVLPIGVALASTAGILLGIPVLRMRGDYLAIVTLGFGEIIRILIRSDLLNNFSGGPKGVSSVGGPVLFGHPFNDVGYVYLILLAVLLVIFVTNRLKNSRVGRAWVSMREDETVAQAMGINTLKHKLLAFAIGAAFAGLGGAIFASRNQFTGPEDHTLMVSINVLCVVIVGGMGSIPGVIAGAFALKGLPEVLRELQDYRIVAFGALLVIMMIIRPEGLIPSKERQLELKEKPEIMPPQPVHPESTSVPEFTDAGER